MINKFNKYYFILFSLMPLILITGPALPDIIISLSLVYYIILFFFINKDYSIFNEKIFLFSLFFWIILIFISFFAYNKTLSFQDSLIFIRFLFIPIIGYYFIFNSEKNILLAIKIIFGTVCFVSFDSLFQFFNYSPINGFGTDIFGFKSNWYGRLTGPFKDELVPGSFVAKFGFLGFILFGLLKKNNSYKIASIIYLSIIGVVCFASGERMALATYFLGITTLILFLKNQRIVILLSFILSITINLIIYKNHPFYNDFNIIESSQYHQGLKIEKIFKCPDNNKNDCKKIIDVQPQFIEILKNFKTSAYGEIYNLGFNMFLDNPLTGIGINNYKFVCENNKKYKKQIKNYNCASHPHNYYLQWLSEGGIFTLLFFIIYLFYLLFFIFKKNENYNLRVIALTNMLILFWPIMSTGSLLKNWNGVLTFFIISICLSLDKIRKDIN